MREVPNRDKRKIIIINYYVIQRITSISISSQEI